MAKITKLDDIVSLRKRRGFIFQSSEVLGGDPVFTPTWVFLYPVRCVVYYLTRATIHEPQATNH